MVISVFLEYLLEVDECFPFLFLCLSLVLRPYASFCIFLFFLLPSSLLLSVGLCIFSHFSRVSNFSYKKRKIHVPYFPLLFLALSRSPLLHIYTLSAFLLCLHGRSIWCPLHLFPPHTPSAEGRRVGMARNSLALSPLLSSLSEIEHLTVHSLVPLFLANLSPFYLTHPLAAVIACLPAHINLIHFTTLHLFSAPYRVCRLSHSLYLFLPPLTLPSLHSPLSRCMAWQTPHLFTISGGKVFVMLGQTHSLRSSPPPLVLAMEDTFFNTRVHRGRSGLSLPPSSFITPGNTDVLK